MAVVAFPRILIAAAVSIALLFARPARGQGDAAGSTCPTRRISRIVIENGDAFSRDTLEPKVIRLASSLASALHVRTRSSFIRKELLFREGDCLDSLRLAESQRLLANYRFLRSARITVDPGADAVVHVATRDEWSATLDLDVIYDDGLKLEDVDLTERNFIGLGMRAQIRRTERRERLDEFYSFGIPRAFGRADATVYYGGSRAGAVYGQSLSYPFVGEVGRASATESSSHSLDFVTYVGGADQQYSHVQIPRQRDFLELAAARRFGKAGRATVFGASVSHERWISTGAPIFITKANFGGGTTAPVALTPPIARQVGDGSLTLASLQLGTRRFRYVEMEGLDGVRDVQSVDIGYNAGVSLGKGLMVAAPRGVPPITDAYGHAHASFGQLFGASFVHGAVTAQAAHTGSAWRDVQAHADLVGYGRASWLPAQTIFFRWSAGGAWSTRNPHQLTLGGRDGVRSMRDDEVPGGHRMVVFLEDRVKLGWPNWSALDLGATVFADAGRTWAGDAPFGENSPWFASAGVGVRIGVPRGTHGVIRPDIVWPLGRGGQPIFRVAYEVNEYGSRFGTPRLGRGMPRLRGPERY
jgi:hypothetical protein